MTVAVRCLVRNATDVVVEKNMGPHVVGNPIRIDTTYTDIDSREPIDPDTVEIHMQRQGSLIVTVTSGTKVADGSYQFSFTPDAAGRWDYAVHSTGPNTVSAQDNLDVDPAI